MEHNRALRGCRRGGGPEKPRKERKIGKFFNCAADYRQAKRRELLREKEPGARQGRGGASLLTSSRPSLIAGSSRASGSVLSDSFLTVY